jgi:hypothetical protein
VLDAPTPKSKKNDEIEIPRVITEKFIRIKHCTDVIWVCGIPFLATIDTTLHREAEMKHLHERECFKPIDISKLTPMERKSTMDALMFLTEKRDGSVKC